MKIARFFTKYRANDIIVLLILNVFCHRGWLKPGIIEYGDWSWYPKEFLVDLLALPFCWTSRFFSGPLFMLHDWPLQWTTGFITRLGFDFGVAERVVYFLPYLIISVLGSYYFTYVLFNKRVICFFSTLFFIFNIPTLQLLLYNRLVAYAFMPLTLVFFLEGKRTRTLSPYLICGLLLTLTAVYELRVAYITLIAISLFFLQEISEIIHKRVGFFKNIKMSLIHLSAVLIVLLILNFYWIYPALVSKGGYMISGYDSSGWVKALSYFKFNHSLAVYLPSWPRGPQPGVIYYIVPLLVFMAIFFRPKDANVRILTLLAVISVFLTKGANPPLGSVYIWLFKYLPGFNAFRDSGKFYLLTCLSYAPLLGVSIDTITARLGEINLKKLKINIKSEYRKSAFLVLMFFIILYLVWPAMIAKNGEASSSHPIPEPYKIIEDFIKNQPDSFRTFWRPYNGRFSFYNRRHPLLRGHYSPIPTHFFLSDIWNPQLFKGTQHIAKILGLLNVKYCFLPLEKESFLGVERDFCISTFNTQKGLKKINLGENIDVYENERFYPRFFSTPQAALIVGGRKALFELASLETMNFSEWVLYFADGLKERNIDLLDNVESIVFNDRGINDFILACVEDRYRFNLSNHAMKPGDAIPQRWLKIDVLPAGNYGSAYGEIVHNREGTIHAPSNWPCELVRPIMVNINKADDYQVWLRAATGPDRGNLSILESKTPKNYSDTCGENFESYNKVISAEGILRNEDFKDINPGFRWVKADSVHWNKGKVYLQIINKGGIGMLDQLVVFPSKVINRLRDYIIKELQAKSIVIIKTGDDFMSDVSVPVAGKYRIAVHVITDEFSGKLKLLAENKDLKEVKVLNRKGSIWIETDPIQLNSGAFRISLAQDGEGTVNLDKFIIYKTDKPVETIQDFFESKDNIPVAWRQINPTKYEIKFTAKKPTYLMFSDIFDPRWILNLESPVQSMCAYSLINSFFIKEAGEIDTTLEFSPQENVYKGLWVSGIGLVLICGYLSFTGISSFRKRKPKNTQGENQ